MKLGALFLALLAAGGAALAQSPEAQSPEAQTDPPIERRVYDTRRVTGDAPVIDGILDDPVWDTVEWSGDFIQRDPSDGEPPSRQSRVKVVYDDSALYFSFRQ